MTDKQFDRILSVLKAIHTDMGCLLTTIILGMGIIILTVAVK